MAGSPTGHLRVASDVGASVGARLREQRRALGLTLSEAARSAGISTSHLSSIEIGNSIPSLPILARVVAVLDLSLNEVLRNVGTTVVNTGTLDPETPGVRIASHDDLLLDVAFVVSEPGEPGPCPLPTLAHEVFVYILEGDLELTVDGAAYELRAGDSLAVTSPGEVGFLAGGSRTVAVWASLLESDSAGQGARVR
ncbi:MAG: helix-turn-helix domain-containing protein [Gaiellaceae bacterium]